MKIIYLALVVVILSFCSLFIGVQDLSPLELFHLDEEKVQTLYISRVPRLVSILLAGVSMSVCGLIMQQITRNKFVSPTTAGTMDWARLGILVSMLIFTSASPLEKMAISCLFAVAGNFLFLKILEKIKYQNAIFIPLVGIMLGGIVSSITTFFAYQYDVIQNISSWLQGDFSMVIQGRYELLYLSIPFVILAYLYANKFTVAGMGESFAVNLGMKYKRIVSLGLIIVAISTSVVILTVGTLPFLGLIIPNLVSMYRGDNIRNSLPHTALLGAAFVLFCDILGRLIIYPYEISIGLMVGVIGSGLFLYMLLRRQSYA